MPKYHVTTDFGDNAQIVPREFDTEEEVEEHVAKMLHTLGFEVRQEVTVKVKADS